MTGHDVHYNVIQMVTVFKIKLIIAGGGTALDGDVWLSCTL